ncbi:hypothetical protein AB0O57_29215 [Streptomyces sp. NPDC091201]|uniref:hypothetical protein n=1 Tax=Streptomyces sp. NPDC091201 TaxID=3155190 RepID=UPI003437A565
MSGTLEQSGPAPTGAPELDPADEQNTTVHRLDTLLKNVTSSVLKNRGAGDR